MIDQTNRQKLFFTFLNVNALDKLNLLNIKIIKYILKKLQQSKQNRNITKTFSKHP